MKPRAKKTKPKIRRTWLRYLLLVGGVVGLATCAAAGYLYLSFARTIDERLHGERERTLPRVYARAVELRRGQSISEQELIERPRGTCHRLVVRN